MKNKFTQDEINQLERIKTLIELALDFDNNTEARSSVHRSLASDAAKLAKNFLKKY